MTKREATDPRKGNGKDTEERRITKYADDSEGRVCSVEVKRRKEVIK